MIIRVLIIDDSLFMRTIIKDMLSPDPEIKVSVLPLTARKGWPK